MFKLVKVQQTKSISKIITVNSSIHNVNHVTNDKPKFIKEFAKPVYGTFFQEKPKLVNNFSEDHYAKEFLNNNLPNDVLQEITPDLVRFGERTANEIQDLGRECEENPPQLRQFDAWGKPTSELLTCSAWKKQKQISAEEGLIAIPYENKYGELSRVYQMMKLYLYAPSSGLYSCPLAMTDGAAKILKEIKSQDSVFSDAYQRVTSRDSNIFWTSGQWMTEKRGGSDVATGTETKAVQLKGDIYRLYGYKWFSSATDSDISFTLARITDDQGNVISGTKGLSLFFLKTRERDQLNNMQMIRLKDKLGTRQLPTAELLLDGTLAQKISEEGRGVKGISGMLQITRIHNSIAAAAAMRRMLHLATDYSRKRKAFGKYLSQHSLHVQTLSRMEVETRAAFTFIFQVGLLLGKNDCKTSTDEEELLLRLLTPLVKLYTAKQAMATVSECLEAFGGMGYLEDSGLPIALRDAQVLPLWEGTTNILALDVLRVLMKTNGEALQVFKSNIINKLKFAEQNSQSKVYASKIVHSFEEMLKIIAADPMVLEVGARDFAYSLSRVFIAACLSENWSKNIESTGNKETFIRWCQSCDMVPFLSSFQNGSYSNTQVQMNNDLVYNN